MKEQCPVCNGKCKVEVDGEIETCEYCDNGKIVSLVPPILSTPSN